MRAAYDFRIKKIRPHSKDSIANLSSQSSVYLPVFNEFQMLYLLYFIKL